MYLMAKHYRLDPPDVDFERIARFFEGRKEKDVRRELTAVKTAADEVNNEMLAHARNILLNALNDMRTKQIKDCLPTDPVGELMVKLYEAKPKRFLISEACHEHYR